MDDALKIIVNGEVQIINDQPSHMTLLDWLRYSKRLTGTKEGCAEGDCGACTVVVRELSDDGELRQKTVNACIQLLPMLHGKEVITVEGVGTDDGPHPVQKALAEGHGSQCGFCTPGFVMSLWDNYEAGAATDTKSVADQLAGNLCRCTGYGPILAAAEAARDEPRAISDQAEATARLAALEPSALSYKHNGSQFWAPRKADDLAELINAHPDATILAGATDIGLWVTKHGFTPEKVIYLGDCADLKTVETTQNGGIRVGAAVSHSDAMTALAGLAPDLGELWRRFASPQVRNAGTLCGNIANGSPIGDAPPALIALGADVLLRQGDTRRRVAIQDYFIAYGQQDRQAGEFVEAVEIASPTKSADMRCYKISKRFDQDITAVLAAINITIDAGIVAAARIAYGGMAAIPKRATAAEAILIGKPFTEETVAEAMQALDQDFAPMTDHRASATYRMTVARNLLLKYYLERRFGDMRVTGRGAALGAGNV
ncbi:MAG: xanthine dehydrogenase small subunit [Pikeienuella sp.]